MINNWDVGVSVKNIEDLKPSIDEFGIIELDLHQILKQIEFGQLREELDTLKDSVYSLHCRHSYERGLDDIKLAREMGAHLAVLHFDYPENQDQLQKQMELGGEAADKYRVLVCLENLCDRERKSGSYSGARDPRIIGNFMDSFNNQNLGLCLDTGHAQSNDFTQWHSEPIKMWLKHIHYHSTDPGKDLHLPVDESSPEYLTTDFFELLANTKYKGVITCENKSLVESLKTQKYLQKISD